MKKGSLIIIIVFGLFLLPNSVFAKEFKQINQITNNNNLCITNNSDTYQLPNGDYLVAEGGILVRINSNGTEVWSYDADEDYFNTLLIDNYIYLATYDGVVKIDVSNGNVVKHSTNAYPYKLVQLGNYILGIDDGYVFKFDQNLNVINVYYTGEGLESGQITYNANITADDNNIYVINMVGTPRQNTGQTYTSYSYETRIIKLDSNLNVVGTLPINEYYLNLYYDESAFFTDNNGNLYMVDEIIVKVDKFGNTIILYNPYDDYAPPRTRASNTMIIKDYTAGTIVGNYLVVGGVSGYIPSSNKNYNNVAYLKGAMNGLNNLTPIVDVYDMDNNLVEEHELEANNSNYDEFDVYNISKSSNEGFLVKWITIKYDDGPDIIKGLLEEKCPLTVTEFGKVRAVKINVKGSGTVRITPNECACGDVVTLDIDEKPGYYLRSVVVRDSSGKKIEVKNNQFVMPCDGAVTVDAQFREITNPKTNSIIIISVILGVLLIGTTLVRRKVFR